MPFAAASCFLIEKTAIRLKLRSLSPAVNDAGSYTRSLRSVQGQDGRRFDQLDLDDSAVIRATGTVLVASLPG